jgi:two-component system NtrC family sensor kinase
MIRVQIADHAGDCREIETFQPMVYVGRAPDSGVALSAPGVEWRHGQIFQRDGRVFYRDLHSQSGSRICSSRGQERRLRHTFHEMELFPGDEIIVGDARFQILSVESDAYAVNGSTAMPVVESRSTADLENLVRRLEKDHQVLLQIYRFEKDLSEVFDLDRLFAAISDAVFEVFEKATHLSVALVDGEEMDLILAARRPGIEAPNRPASLSRFLVEQVVHQGEAILFNLTEAGSLQIHQKDAREILPTKSVRLNRIQSGICAPLWSGTSIIGVLEIDNRVEATVFSADERDLLVLFANRAALAIEKHRRYTRDLEAARDATIGQVVSKVVHDLTNHFGVLRPLGELTDLELKSLATHVEQNHTDVGVLRKSLASLIENWQRVKIHHELMWDLLDDLRHYAKKRDPEYERVPLRDVVEVCLESARFRASDREKKVSFRLSGNLDRISFVADAIGLRRSLQNLVNNAVDSIPEGTAGEVEIAAGVVRVGSLRYVSISVCDNGIGIPGDLLGKIFDYGFTTKTGVSGSGFGLAVTTKIVSEHRGFIRISSKKNEGTKVEMLFPAVMKVNHLKRYPSREDDLVEVLAWSAVEAPVG